MLDNITKKNIDNCRDTLVGKVPDPKSQIEQITLALIYKFMDDMDRESEELGGKPKFFTGEFEKYGWRKLLDQSLGGKEMLDLYSEALDILQTNANLPELFRNIFKNAYLPYRDPATLKMFLKHINDFEYSHSEKLGDAFEYLLSVMGSQGDAGQFRTPRHVIDFIAKCLDPKKNETVSDPACGTSGFLLSAYKHILSQNTDKRAGDKLTPDERKKLSENFTGYDISPDMVRLSLVNMYLHGFATPKIFEYDTLSSEDRWNETFDVILANPPFMTPKGGIRPHKKFGVQANKAEVLFTDYIAEHLNKNGRAGIVVPNGIVATTQTAYKQLRKLLVEDSLIAVISLPAGCFNPYSGVKTSILMLDKGLAKKSDQVLFIKVNNDGYDLGAQRREIDKNDLPLASEAFNVYKESISSGKVFDEEKYGSICTLVEKEKILANKDVVLNADRYVDSVVYDTVTFPIVKLEEVVEIFDNKRKPISKGNRKEGKYPYYGATGIVDYVDDFIFNERLVLVGEDGAKWGMGDKTAFMAEGKYWVNNHAHVLKPIQDKIIDTYLVEVFNYMDLNPFITGVTVPKLNQENLRSIEIPLPPLEIQEQIVKEIKGYQKIIDGAKMVVENYKPTININPEWELVELVDFCDFKRGPFGGSLKKEIFVKEGYLVYEQYHPINDDFTFGRYFISEEKYQEMLAFSVAENDILISCSGTMGKVAIVPNGHKRGIINQALLRLRPKLEIVNPSFIRIYLEQKAIQSKYFTNQEGAAIQNVMSVSELKQIPFPKLTLEEQEIIVSQIEKEQSFIYANKQLITLFEQKIKDRINEVWGVKAE